MLGLLIIYLLWHVHFIVAETHTLAYSPIILPVFQLRLKSPIPLKQQWLQHHKQILRRTHVKRKMKQTPTFEK